MMALLRSNAARPENVGARRPLVGPSAPGRLRGADEPLMEVEGAPRANSSPMSPFTLCGEILSLAGLKGGRDRRLP